MSEQATNDGATRHTLAAVLAAIDKGVTVLGAAKALGCSRSTVKRYRRRWASVDEALESKRGELVDIAESQLRLAVLRGEPWAVMLVLKTLGKDDGYSERTELTGANAEPIQFIEVVKPADVAGSEGRND